MDDAQYSFWRKNTIANYAKDFGIENYEKPGGTIRLSEENFLELEKRLERNNLGNGTLTPDEREWIAAILYNYGRPWGG